MHRQAGIVWNRPGLLQQPLKPACVKTHESSLASHQGPCPAPPGSKKACQGSEDDGRRQAHRLAGRPPRLSCLSQRPAPGHRGSRGGVRCGKRGSSVDRGGRARSGKVRGRGHRERGAAGDALPARPRVGVPAVESRTGIPALARNTEDRPIGGRFHKDRQAGARAILSRAWDGRAIHTCDD